MARKSYGYNQALELLKGGEKIRWVGMPTCKASINGITVHYPAWLRLHKLLTPFDEDSYGRRGYILKEVK